jgi:proteasome accessory factor B
MNINRITRLLQLLQLLQSGTRANVAELAVECGVSQRTTFRDLEALREAGLPLVFDKKQQRYCIAGVFFLPTTNFTAEEAFSLVTLATEVGRGVRLPFLDAVKSAAFKLENCLPPKLQQKLRMLRGAIHICSGNQSRLDEKGSILQQLVDAQAARRVVAITYDRVNENEVIQTRLNPYQILFSQHCWYVVGHSARHRTIRTFDLSHVHSVNVLSETFIIPANFSLKRYLRNAWEVAPEPGRDKKVALQFKPTIACNVAAVVWHKTQETTFLSDGSLEFRAQVSGLKEITPWVLSYGDQVEVLQPTRLRRMVAEQARKMATIYNTHEANFPPRCFNQKMPRKKSLAYSP